MSHLERCAWKLVDPDKFVLGVSAKRCGKTASVKILRPHRKTDLCLCEPHLNTFVEKWGLHNQVQILCDPESKPLNPVDSSSNHPLDYDECDCVGTLEHARALGRVI